MTGFQEATLIPFHTFLQTEFKLAAEWSQSNLNRVDDQSVAIEEFASIDRDMLFDLRNTITALRLTKPGDVAVTGYAQHSDPARFESSVGWPSGCGVRSVSRNMAIF